MVLHTLLLASDNLWLTIIPCDSAQHTCADCIHADVLVVLSHLHAGSAQTRDFVQSFPRCPLSALLHFELRNILHLMLLSHDTQYCGSTLHDMSSSAHAFEFDPSLDRNPVKEAWVQVNTFICCCTPATLHATTQKACQLASSPCLSKVLSHLSQIPEVLQQPQVATCSEQLACISQCLCEKSSRSACFASIFVHDMRGWRLGLHCPAGGSSRAHMPAPCRCSETCSCPVTSQTRTSSGES